MVIVKQVISILFAKMSMLFYFKKERDKHRDHENISYEYISQYLKSSVGTT